MYEEHVDVHGKGGSLTKNAVTPTKLEVWRWKKFEREPDSRRLDVCRRIIESQKYDPYNPNPNPNPNPKKVDISTIY